MILNIAIAIFIVMELANVLIMYFKPDFKYGNSMTVFNEWHKSKADSNSSLFARYMVNWVANCKLIFIAILAVVLFVGDLRMKLYSVVAAVLSIGLYFITLHPIIRKLDANGEITPKGYSRTLGFMIAGFMVMFAVALILHLALGL